MQMIYFTKKKELVDKYNKLTEKFNKMRLDSQIELDLKDQLIKKLSKEKQILAEEIYIAKTVIRDPVLCQVA